MKPQFTLKAVFLIITTACIFCAFWHGVSRIPRGYRITEPVDPFPRVGEIEHMTALVWEEKKTQPRDSGSTLD